MRKTYLLFSIVYVFLACNSSKDPNAAASVTNGPYSVDVPAGWTTDHRRMAGVDYFFLLAPKTFEDPNTTINIITEPMQGLTLPDFMVHTIGMVKQSIPTAVILKQGAVTAKDGLRGFWYSYHMEPEGVKMNVTCYVFPKDSTAYILTAGTLEKDAERYKTTFDDVAMSFKFN